ncbi:MAG: OmpA family protein [Sphingorhabdus sp.]
MKSKLLVVTLTALTMFPNAAAYAQASARSPLNDLGISELRQELDTRYNAALAMTQDRDIVRADDSKFLWASETKVWCGIAIGYSKSGTKDQESIDRCDAFHTRMNPGPRPARPPVMPPPPLPQPACSASRVTEIFFDWNVDTPAGEAETSLAAMAENRRNCGWGRLTVTGHADRSGSDGYNSALSMRRAAKVAATLEQLGVARSDLEISAKGEGQLKVDTADGVREPANRRVEIIAQDRGN